MAQLSFYSALAQRPRVADLAGLLCAPGQAVRFGSGDAARLSIVVADRWRVRAMALACLERGVHTEVTSSTEGHPLLRTAFRADVAPLAAQWVRGAVKAVPEAFTVDGAVLRLWAIAAGEPSGAGYQFGLDPHAEQTHAPLHEALTRCGLVNVVLGRRGGGPALRIAGRRRLARLAELVGDPPQDVDPARWPG